MALAIIAFASATNTLAQEPKDTTQPAATGTDKPGFYLRSPDGTLLPLSTLGVDEAELEKLIRQKKTETPPQYVITSAALEGNVVGKLAYLDVTLTVQLNVDDDRWVSVPVGLNEGRLTDASRYVGDGEAVFDRKGTAESGTKHWFFKGSGKHKLTLPIVIQVREPQHLRQAIRLRLPDAAATRLALDVPSGNITVEPPKGAGARTTRTDDGTRIDIWGLGTVFALQWDIRPDVANSQPLLRSRTVLIANLTTDPFSITAKQTLNMQQGSTSKVEVTLPTGLLAKSTEPQQIDPTGRVSQVEIDEDTGTVQLTFAEPLSDSIILNWSLASKEIELTRRWTFTGFLVTGAQEQWTDLELTPPEGVAVQPVKSLGIQRQNMRANRLDQRTRRRLLNAESEFTVELRDVEPFFTVTPRTALYFSEDQVRIETRFRVRVLRGSVQELKLTWPGFKEEEWKLLPPPQNEKLTDWTSSEFAGDDSLTLNLLTRAAGSFEIGIGAVRTLNGNDEFPVSLPGVVSETRQPTTLVLATNPNIDVELIDRDKTTSAPIPMDERMRMGFEPAGPRLQMQALLVRSEEKRFTASFQTRDRQLSATTAIAFDIKEDAINVEQLISYQLDFDHIAELRYSVPTGLDATVSLADGTMLRRLATGESTTRYALPEPITGGFGVMVRYRVPYSKASATVDVPIVLSGDCSNSELRVGVKQGASMQVTPVGNWSPVFSRQLEAEWTANQAVDKLALTLASPLDSTAREFTVTRALVQSKVAGTVVDGRVSFVLRGQFKQLVLDVPEDTRVSTIAWNGTALGPKDWNVDRLVDTRVLTIRQANVAGTGILTVDYRSSAAELSWNRKLRPVCPTMPRDTPVDDVIWQVILPTGEHLSGYDTASRPCFEWSLGSFGWSRQPTDEFKELDMWLRRGTTSDSEVVRTVAGNQYAFQLPSLQPNLRVSTVDQSFILLLGSGAAFLAAFLLITYSPRRLAIIIPTVGLAVSLLSLKYTPAIKLLLQPVILGLVLAGLAFLIDRRRYRRGYGAYSMDRTKSPTVAAAPEATDEHRPIAIPGSSQ